MDNLGIDKLIEMIEERFGKAVAHGLLVIVMLAVAAVGLQTIWTAFVVPVGDAAVSAIKFTATHTLSKEDSRALIFRILTGALSVAVGWLIMHLIGSYYRKKFARITEEARAEIEIRADEVKAAREELERFAKRVQIATDETERMRKEIQDARKEVLNLIHSAEQTEPQSPQNTESETSR